MTINSEADLAGMQRVGRLVAETVTHMRSLVRSGISTGELDAAAERFTRAAGARSAPRLDYDFPGATCGAPWKLGRTGKAQACCAT
jgi:methionyl aminopeptidase